tara:strand:- start:282 stop:1721 length:1440 start_codon:yes stop_codon:yes gene_type:complete
MSSKLFIRELLNRRVPQIISSYIIASTSLIVFIDWLVARYDFSQTYVTISLFCLISILPSVLILAYFHGAPGKDEWTKIEKYAIPINIIFIALIIITYKNWFSSNKERDTIIDNIYYIIDSRQDLVDINLNEIYSPQDLIDNEIEGVTPVSQSFLNEIYKEVPPRINSKLTHQDVNIYTPQNKAERKSFNIFPDPDYFMLEEKSDSLFVKKLKNNLIKLDDSLDVFHNVNIDGYISVNLYRIKFINEKYGIVYTMAYYSMKDEHRVSMNFKDEGYIDFEDDPDDNIKDELVDEISEYILYKRFGGLNVGKVNDILSDDIVSISIENNNLNLLKGNLLKGFRTYWYNHDWVDNKDEFNKQIDDINREIEYIKDNPLYIIETGCDPCMYYELNDGVEHKPKNIKYILDEYLQSMNSEIYSLKNNKSNQWEHTDRTSSASVNITYNLEVIQVTETHVTAKIISKNAPFTIPKVFDKIRLLIE